MTLQDIGTIGELVAVAAALVTLIYVAIQVRDNARALDRSNEFAQASSIRDINVMFCEVNWRLAGDGELADIYTRALGGESLTPTETPRFVAFLNTYIATIENLIGQQSLDLGYSELDSDSAIDLMAPIVRDLLATEAGARWWQEDARHLYVDEFRRQIDTAVERVSQSDQTGDV